MSDDWKNGSCIRCETDFDNVEDDNKEIHFAWFNVKPNLVGETDQEKKEKIIAIREQISAGILSERGIPIGMEPPKPKENKWERKRRRDIERKQKKNK